MRNAFVLAAALALSGCLLPAAARAQTGNPVTRALRASLQRSSRIMAAAAEKMPAAKYSFRPTPGSRTFAALVLHIGNSNRFSCHNLTGAPPAPANKLTASSPKAELVQALRESFAYCEQALAGFSDARLGATVPSFGGRRVTAAASVLELSDDLADHYSQEAAYLRLNGMLPPTAHHGKP